LHDARYDLTVARREAQVQNTHGFSPRGERFRHP
jgi:hypothetical protein